ncbi:Hypothetical protein, putative [Bodo saltans]|uniref:Stealth protein CR2 conserved region 2 domain-containing protein n=1 Tax=Bodo saltans TaxID=75058 RepID=A0A0S4JRH7_BODSA|nr:Hypothetical protein, putative [Bodo saltans]|eukprot:CUG93376.1 Hypothetical protein, putative [Bodo saltans]
MKERQPSPLSSLNRHTKSPHTSSPNNVLNSIPPHSSSHHHPRRGHSGGRRVQLFAVLTICIVFVTTNRAFSPVVVRQPVVRQPPPPLLCNAAMDATTTVSCAGGRPSLMHKPRSSSQSPPRATTTTASTQQKRHFNSEGVLLMSAGSPAPDDSDHHDDAAVAARDTTPTPKPTSAKDIEEGKSKWLSIDAVSHETTSGNSSMTSRRQKRQHEEDNIDGDDAPTRNPQQLTAHSYTRPPRLPPRRGRDEQLSSHRWPLLPQGTSTIRKKRRFHSLPHHQKIPEALNQVWRCPDHRARSPTGFLPGASMHPIDSVTAVMLISPLATLGGRQRVQMAPARGAGVSLSETAIEGLHVSRDPLFAEALISRDDIDESPYFRHLHTSPEKVHQQLSKLQMHECINNMSTKSAKVDEQQPRQQQQDGDPGEPQFLSSTPLQVDIVFTYVNGSAPSFLAGLKQRNLSYDPQRYHDWDELRYSLRSVYMRAVCAHDPPFMARDAARAARAQKDRFHTNPSMSQQQTDDNRRRNSRIECEEGSFVRTIFIVVADKDQIPAWLDTSHRLIRVIEHHQIFPEWADATRPLPIAREQQRRRRHQQEAPATTTRTYLPTFNSHAIELHLHRIPGLSRFFIYLNNDMLFGRRVSLLDYFRPISESRQALRARFGASLDIPQDPKEVPRDALSLENNNNSGGCHESVAASAYGLFEPIIYGESEARSCVPHRRNGAAEALRMALVKDNVTAQATTATRGDPQACASHPLRPSALFDLECFYPSRGVLGDPMMKKTHFNSRLAFDRLDGVAVLHTYPHFPQLFDRLLLERMIEVDFADVAEDTRRSFDRTDRDLWVTLLYSTYALAHRLAVETRLEMKNFTARRLQEKRQHGRYRDEFLSLDLSTDHLPMSDASEFISWADATLREKGTLDQSAQEDRSTRSLLSMLGRNYFDTDTWLPEKHWRFHFHKSEETLLGGTAAASSSASIAAWTKFIKNTRHFNMSWMGPDALLACSRRATCTSVAREKLYHNIVVLFDKMSSYRFCMLKNRRGALGCLRDVYASSSGGGTRLFWALNDDWAILDPSSVRSDATGEFGREPQRQGRNRRRASSYQIPSRKRADHNASSDQLAAKAAMESLRRRHQDALLDAAPSQDRHDSVPALDAATLPTSVMRQLLEHEGHDMLAEHRKTWNTLKRRVVHSRAGKTASPSAAATQQDDNFPGRHAMAQDTSDNDASPGNPRVVDPNDDDDGPTLPPNARRRAAFARSKTITESDAATLSRVIMLGITRNAGMAPWELHAASHHNNAKNRLAKPAGNDDAPRPIDGRIASSFPPPLTDAEVVESLRMPFGPWEHPDDVSARVDVISFLREEYRRDRFQSKEDWSWNPLNL